LNRWCAIQSPKQDKTAESFAQDWSKLNELEKDALQMIEEDDLF
jgi:hypothetical protein